MKLEPYFTPASNEAAAASPEVFQQLGAITRLLHDTLNQLGVIPSLQGSAGGLPDARRRLNYIAKKTGDAAEKVLNLVELVKVEQSGIAEATRRIARAVAADPVHAVASGAMTQFVEHVEAATARGGAHLTDIMVAQDFHDLTGQVVAKVLALAGDIEEGLVQLLVQAAPPQHMHRVESHGIASVRGPQGNFQPRADLVSNQKEVDDLLASLGF